MKNLKLIESIDNNNDYIEKQNYGGWPASQLTNQPTENENNKRK